MNSIAVRNRIIEENEGLIYKAVARWYEMYKTWEFNDVKEVVMLAAIKAANRWDARRSTFGNLLHWQIRSEMSHLKVRREAAFRNKYQEVAFPEMYDEDCTQMFALETPRDMSEEIVGEMHWDWLLSKLNEREAYLISKIYKDGESCRAVAETLGVSHQRADAIHHHALDKLRKFCTKH